MSQDLKAARRALNTTEDLEAKGWYHSIELPDGRVLQGTQSLARLRERAELYGIPSDLRGKRVLDIGAWDGWFTFEMERRGASVVAVDCVEIENFRYAHRQLGSRAEYLELDVYDLTPERVGRFDIVLCLGVVYHLKHPLLAIERVCDLTADMAIVESFVADDVAGHTEYPWAEFYESDELGGQADNWSGPNIECLLAWCRTAGFARTSLIGNAEHRASVACFRQWPPPSPEPGCPPPIAETVLDSQNNGFNFQASRDRFLSLWFISPEPDLTRETVFPEVAGYGVKPMFVQRIEGNRWQANFKLPLGLSAGWQPVRLRTARSGFSNNLRIAVNMPAAAIALHLDGVCDGVDWTKGQVLLAHGRITMFVTGLADNADLANVRVYVNDSRLTPDYLEPVRPGEPANARRQVNARFPRTLESGPSQVIVRFGGVESNASDLQVLSRGTAA